MPAIVEGLNEKGLAVGIFYFPGYGKYEDVDLTITVYVCGAVRRPAWCGCRPARA